MNALRRAHRFGRLLAAWLLFSFLAMAVAPVGPLGAADASRLAAGPPTGELCSDANDLGRHDQVGLSEHQADPDTDHLHADDAAGCLSHCPLCMHAAAPPPLLPAPRLTGGAPTGRPTPAQRPAARVRTAAPPPGRGPPVFS